MKILFYCPSCEEGSFLSGWEPELVCACGERTPVDPGDELKGLTLGRARAERPRVSRCVFCGYSHLHRRKDFPRRLGLVIVTVAAISMWWVPHRFFFLPLVAASVLDFLLYFVVPWKLVCYVCGAEYLGFEPGDDQEPFDLEEATRCGRLRWGRRPGRDAAPHVS